MLDTIPRLRLMTWGFRLGYWGLCLVLGAGILFALVMALTSGNPNMGNPLMKAFMILVFFLPGLGFLADLAGRILCTFVPKTWESLRTLPVWSLGFYGFQFILILVMIFQADASAEDRLLYAAGAGLAGCLSWILLVETIRRLAQKLGNERLFFQAFAMFVMWGVLAGVLILVAALVLFRPSLPPVFRNLYPLLLLGGGLLAFGCLLWYGNLLTNTARALQEKIRTLESSLRPAVVPSDIPPEINSPMNPAPG